MVKFNKKPFQPSPALEPYLSPPVGSYDPVYSFRPNLRKRRPSQQQAKRKQAVDQLPSGSDAIVSAVTVLPPAKTRNSSSKLSTVADSKRVNYNYHPIIDFFERETQLQKQKNVDRIGNVSQRNTWRPMLNRRG